MRYQTLSPFKPNRYLLDNYFGVVNIVPTNFLLQTKVLNKYITCRLTKFFNFTLPKMKLRSIVFLMQNAKLSHKLIQQKARKESSNAYVPRFFSYLVDFNYKSSSYVHEVPEDLYFLNTHSHLESDLSRFFINYNKTYLSSF